jgi:hypothetical protein
LIKWVLKIHAICVALFLVFGHIAMIAGMADPGILGYKAAGTIKWAGQMTMSIVIRNAPADDGRSSKMMNGAPSSAIPWESKVTSIKKSELVNLESLHKLLNALKAP